MVKRLRLVQNELEKFEHTICWGQKMRRLMDNITLAKQVDTGGMEKASAVEWRLGMNYRFF